MNDRETAQLLRDARLQVELAEFVHEHTQVTHALLRRILEVLDAMHRAEGGSGADTVAIFKKMLLAALTQSDVQLFGAPGDDFDPRIHTAVEVRPSGGTPATLLEILSFGCRYAGVLVRPARVIVSEL